MNIFYNRPLFSACFTFIAVSTMAYFLPSMAKYVILAAFFCVLLISGFMCLVSRLGRMAKHFLMYCVLCSLAVVLAMSVSLSFFELNNNRFQDVYGDEHTVSATVASCDHQSEIYSVYTVKVDRLDDKNANHKAKLICQYDACLEVGDSVIIRATASEPEDKRDGIFNEKLTMLSDGMFVKYTSVNPEGLTIVTSEDFDLGITFSELNDKLSHIITDRVDGEEGNLSSAILLGNKQLLNNKTERDFRRAGVSHILALSGMHMTVIMGVFSILLWMLTGKAKKVGVISAVVALFYLALTGFSLSATRAVLMLLIVYLGMIITAMPDPLTSLSVAGVVIIVIFPGSILDPGFWMSFAATFGILVFMSPFHEFMINKLYRVFVGKHRKRIVHTITYVLDLIVASVFAIIPLIVVMCIFIKEMSWFSVITSAVLSLPSSALILFSLLLICLHFAPYVSGVLTRIIFIIADFMIDFCADVARTEGAVFSLNYPFIDVMALIIGFSLIYCVASKHKFKIISAIPLIVSILLLAGTATVYEYVNKDNVKATFVNSSSVSNVLVLSNEGQAVICDLSNGSKTTYSKALDELYNARVTEIRAIMLTGYTYLHSATYYDIFASEMVREIWLPYPNSEDDLSKMNKIYEVAQKYGVEAYIYGNDDVLKAFENTRISVFQDSIERSSVPVTLIEINSANHLLVYSSPAINESKLKEEAERLFSSADYIIFGNKGPKVKKAYKIPPNRRIDAIVFANTELAALFDSSEVFGTAYFHAPEKIDLYLEE